VVKGLFPENARQSNNTKIVTTIFINGGDYFSHSDSKLAGKHPFTVFLKYNLGNSNFTVTTGFPPGLLFPRIFYT